MQVVITMNDFIKQRHALLILHPIVELGSKGRFAVFFYECGIGFGNGLLKGELPTFEKNFIERQSLQRLPAVRDGVEFFE